MSQREQSQEIVEVNKKKNELLQGWH